MLEGWSDGQHIYLVGISEVSDVPDCPVTALQPAVAVINAAHEEAQDSARRLALAAGDAAPKVGQVPAHVSVSERHRPVLASARGQHLVFAVGVPMSEDGPGEH